MDARTPAEKTLWALIGPPLYYCSDCKRAVKVTPADGGEPNVVRPCGSECGVEIIAPRKAIAAGQGGMNMRTRAKLNWLQFAAAVTGRCV